MKKHIKKIIKRTIGITLICFGILGLFLPILQGILLIIAGLLIIDSQRFKKQIGQFKEKFKLK
jgi:uncharacterized protein YqgC (DUF456 family)